MKSADIRQAFFDFFEEKLHQIVPSAPIVIKNDPTLLFTNAGMNQFKEYFLGNTVPPFSRVADTQKCLRVSGKHNDLEEVGVDTYHHTMFEMLGNWSFGNASELPTPYFKEEAIAWSWELLTKIYNIPLQNIYVTIFEGDAKEGLPKDEESIAYWEKWIEKDRIILGNKKDNFWEMGDTGPCGPCTEIHVDCRTEDEKKKIAGKSLVNNDHPQVIEIWNNVFIQYNRKKDGSLEMLPAKHVDTGMGFERLVRVLQNKQSNYDTDVFTGTINVLEEITRVKYDYSDSRQAIAFRVIADHIRAISFPIADGQLPSNTGAGYVIRRILRRAVRYYFSYLGIQEPLLYQLVPLIATQFEHVFPELFAQKDFVSKVIHEEENNFLKTLDAGLKKLNLLISAGINIDGTTAFELYDTYGFPIDLTTLIATENKLTVDIHGFDLEMQKQKDRSRAAAAVDKEDWILLGDQLAPKFVGYQLGEAEGKILKYRKTTTKGKASYQVVLDVTPFYAESGGQVGDTGLFISGNEKIPVLNTKKENDQIVHFVDKLPSDLSKKITARINTEKRKSIKAHHSATHLMHAALRKVLGPHVVQKGSLVNEDSLRFDFAHFAKLTKEEISKVEAIVNEKIRENVPVVISEMNKEAALATGAMALFGEKYGDTVRVVTIDPAFSIELCGGTHISFTGELGFFKILSETAIGAGVRRIEAVSGSAAERFIQLHLSELESIRQLLNNAKSAENAVSALMQEHDVLKKQVEKMAHQQIVALKADLLKKVEQINGVPFLGAIVDLPETALLKKLTVLIHGELPNSVILLLSTNEGKVQVVLMIDDQLVATRNLQAQKIIKDKIAPLIKGGGGGQPSFASAGGTDNSRLSEVIGAVKELL
ncbi:MAG: alanine--tRNA ligase [Bacteroidetes bacterium]|nr:alanine--tRNA ligase [Bacteroidota bacterium]